MTGRKDLDIDPLVLADVWNCLWISGLTDLGGEGEKIEGEGRLSTAFPRCRGLSRTFRDGSASDKMRT
jgi:hypothetical protein